VPSLCERENHRTRHNQVELLKDATAHAEMLAITQAEASVETGG